MLPVHDSKPVWEILNIYMYMNQWYIPIQLLLTKVRLHCLPVGPGWCATLCWPRPSEPAGLTRVAGCGKAGTLECECGRGAFGSFISTCLRSFCNSSCIVSIWAGGWGRYKADSPHWEERKSSYPSSEPFHLPSLSQYLSPGSQSVHYTVQMTQTWKG